MARTVTLWMCKTCQTVKVVQRPETLGGRIYCVACRHATEAVEVSIEPVSLTFIIP